MCFFQGPPQLSTSAIEVAILQWQVATMLGIIHSKDLGEGALEKMDTIPKTYSNTYVLHIQYIYIYMSVYAFINSTEFCIL